MNDIIYHRYQPVTWGIGVVNAPAGEVADAIAFADPRAVRIRPTRSNSMSINASLQSLEPLNSPARLIVVSTVDGRAGLFCNIVTVQTITEFATWCGGEVCDARAFFVLRIPNTITPDQKHGNWGARQLTVRDPINMAIIQEPTFGISVINDCGRWKFDRCGEPQPFEEQDAYRSRRVKDRFTDDRLLFYCDKLGIPVYDPAWYTEEIYTVTMNNLGGTSGLTYNEVRSQFRIPHEATAEDN